MAQLDCLEGQEWEFLEHRDCRGQSVLLEQQDRQAYKVHRVPRAQLETSE